MASQKNASYPVAGERYRAFLEKIWGESTAVRDDAADPGLLPELELQARWFAGELGREFISADGEPVEIVQFGHWNHGAGPDFTDATVRVGGAEKRGAIEIDLQSVDWENHGHGANPAFDEVVLHVICQGPGKGRFFTRTSRHREVAQVAIDPKSLGGAGPLRHLPEARLGRCALPLADLEEDRLESLLTGAAQFRMMQKAARFSAMTEAHSRNQALFQGVAEALGYAKNKLTMAVLAQRLPIRELQRLDEVERESALFGAAGFISLDHYESADEAARAYLKGLWDCWWKLRDRWEPSAERRLQWNGTGTRPINHPQRRVAALAIVAGRWRSLVSCLNGAGKAKTGWPKEIRRLLSELSHPYWRHHYTLRSRPSEKPMALIGKDRIQDLMGNVFFPLAVRENPEQWERYRDLPGSAENEKLRRALLRLFGENNPAAQTHSRRYYHQQALLQIYQDFCLADASECAACPFPEQLRQWK